MRYLFIVFILLFSSMSYNTIATAKTINFATLENLSHHPVDVAVDYHTSSVIITALEDGSLDILITDHKTGNDVHRSTHAIHARGIIVIDDLPSSVSELDVTTTLKNSTQTITITL